MLVLWPRLWRRPGAGNLGVVIEHASGALASESESKSDKKKNSMFVASALLLVIVLLSVVAVASYMLGSNSITQGTTLAAAPVIGAEKEESGIDSSGQV